MEEHRGSSPSVKKFAGIEVPPDLTMMNFLRCLRLRGRDLKSLANFRAS